MMHDVAVVITLPINQVSVVEIADCFIYQYEEIWTKC